MQVQPNPGDNGLGQGALLRPSRGHTLVLRHELRHTGQADQAHMHRTEDRSWALSQPLLQRHTHQDEPHIQDLQPGPEEQQAAVLHVAQVAGRHIRR